MVGVVLAAILVLTGAAACGPATVPLATPGSTVAATVGPASPPPAWTATAPVTDLASRPTATPAATASPGPAATQPLGGTTYTVQVGDTIWAIAERLGVPLLRLIEANPAIDPNLLHAGDVLRIPGPDEVLPTPGNAAARVRVDAGGLRLRAAPSLQSDVLAYLDALTRLNVIGRTADSTWLQVVTPTGETGWVTTAWTDVYVALAKVPIITAALDAATVTPAPAASPAGTPGGAATDSAAPPTTAAPGVYNTISGISAHARQVFLQGQQLGNRANVFSKVGDSITLSAVFLFPIGDGQYNLHDYAGFQPVIDYFSAQRVRGSPNSFDNLPLAAKVGWRAQAVLTPGQGDPAVCQANETPLACEYRLVRPSVALIMLGTNDVVSTPDDQFEADMKQVIEFTLGKSIVPVLSTIPPLFRTGLDGRSEQLNVIITRLAREYDIPLWDYWSALQGLPNSGIGSDGVHPKWAPVGHAADFTPEYLQYGMVVRNLTALYVLDAVWRQVIQPH
jgi:LysM repeat protein